MLASWLEAASRQAESRKGLKTTKAAWAGGLESAKRYAILKPPDCTDGTKIEW